MRLIGDFETESQAYAFYSFLSKEGIQNTYEPYLEEKSGAKHYRIWVYDEDELVLATEWMDRFKQNPQDPQFQSFEISLTAKTLQSTIDDTQSSETLPWQSVQEIPIQERRFSFPLTYFVIILCGFLFLWNDFQEEEIVQEKGPIAVKIALTPVMQWMLFDYPNSYRFIEEAIDTFAFRSYKKEAEIPREAKLLIKKAGEAEYKGAYGFLITVKTQGWKSAKEVPLFEKIREGQLWRLFTPCLLHREFLHLLFNMFWAWLLLKQIEERLGKWKICLLIFSLGVISNLFQYLISGPYFLGFSGVIVGLAGFIWVRQKKAPWEGYPLQKSTALFLLFFVIAMFALELLTFALKLFTTLRISPHIANTAHIIGGLMGLLLGKSSFFRRRVR
jgi:GlpG protein